MHSKDGVDFLQVFRFVEGWVGEHPKGGISRDTIASCADAACFQGSTGQARGLMAEGCYLTHELRAYLSCRVPKLGYR